MKIAFTISACVVTWMLSCFTTDFALMLIHGHMRPPSIMTVMGFVPIPFAMIGLIIAGLRHVWRNH